MAPPLSSSEKMLCIPVLAACITAGVCDDAQAMEREISAVKYSTEQAVSFSSLRDRCLQELSEVITECSQANWDGYGAAPLDPIAISRAKQFIDALPTDSSYPEVGAMPDGDISLDWDIGSRRSLTVALGPQTRLAYAMINADEERSGTLSFIQAIPKSLLRTIHELHSYG